MKIIFLKPVLLRGRLYESGEVTEVTDKIGKDLLSRGLVAEGVDKISEPKSEPEAPKNEGKEVKDGKKSAGPDTSAPETE